MKDALAPAAMEYDLSVYDVSLQSGNSFNYKKSFVSNCTSRCKGADFWLVGTGPKRFEGEPLASSNSRDADFNVSRWLQCFQAIQS